MKLKTFFAEFSLVFVGAVLWVLLVHSCTGEMRPRWDALYYVDMATHGVVGNPNLVAPFCYRPGMPLLAGAISSWFLLSIEDAFKIIVYIATTGIVVTTFLFSRSQVTRFSHALVPTAVVAMSFTHVRFPLFFYSLVDVAAYPIMIAAIWALLRQKIFLCLALSWIGLFFKEFLIIPSILVLLLLLKKVWQGDRSRHTLFSILGILIVTGSIVAVPRLLLPITQSVQEVDPLNKLESLRRLLLNPLDIRRDLNIVLAFGGYWLPTLLLITPSRMRRIWDDMRDCRLWLTAYVAIVLLLTMYGGTNIGIFVSYSVAAQVIVLCALLRCGLSPWELLLMFVAIFSFNKVLIDIPLPMVDVEAHFDFFPGYSSHVNMKTLIREAEILLYISLAVILRKVIQLPRNPINILHQYRTKLTGWGRYPTVDGLQWKSENLTVITEKATLSRGLGRSYGDSSLPATADSPVADTTLADRLLSFDPSTGMLRAEAGVSLLELNRVFLRRGWFVPVSPGTQFVTLGGMIASDVHGKNHHVDGCFGQHVLSIKLRVADGRIVECSDAAERELFRATIGGMGLTGHILEAEFPMRQIPSPWIWGESERIDNLDAMVTGLKMAAKDWPMTVGWVDCLARGDRLGRGILMKGRWATPDEAPKKSPPWKRRFRIPFEFPAVALCKLSMKAFNLTYYWKHIQRVKRGIVHPDAFFYPLDMLDDWNLVYGRRGFTQYQCALPHAADNGPARRFLKLFVSGGGMGFLCVIKDCGAEGKGMLSFPRPGVSIALDFPIRGEKTQALVDRLNELVIAEGGRIYLTKDTFTRPEHFRAMEPRLDAFNTVRHKWDPQVRIRSAQSVRLLGDPA